MKIKGNHGETYEVKTEVHKIPSSGKYKAQGYVQRILKNGSYSILAQQSLTFDTRKDADEFAKSYKQVLIDIARRYASY